MPCNHPRDCADRDPASPAEVDRKTQRAVLAFVLAEHPSQPTILELSRALNAREDGFETEDAVERAVRDLDSAGLLSCPNGRVVAPTRAALSFDSLEQD